MTEPELGHRILAVDDEEMWRNIIGRALEVSGVDHEVVEDADTAVERLGTGEFSGVITDGLNEGWQRVVEAARAVGARTVLMSGSFMVVAEAKRDGIVGFNKATMSREDIVEAIKAVAPE